MVKTEEPVVEGDAKARRQEVEVVVYPDWCKGCGICVAFCPGKVLELGKDGKARPIAGRDCLNCGFCEHHCPDFAIMVRPRRAPGQGGNGQRIRKAHTTTAPATPAASMEENK